MWPMLIALTVMLAVCWLAYWRALKAVETRRPAVPCVCVNGSAADVWTVGLRLEDETGRTVDPERDPKAFRRAELVRPVMVYQCSVCRRVRDV